MEMLTWKYWAVKKRKRKRRSVISLRKQSHQKPIWSCTEVLYRSPPLLYKSYCRFDGQICYQPGKMEIAFYQPVSIWITTCQLVYPTSSLISASWQVSYHQPTFLIFYLNGWNIVGMCRSKCRIISFFLEKASFISCHNYSMDIALLAGTFHKVATMTICTYQLVKCTIWQKIKTQSSCQLKHTSYWIFVSWCTPDCRIWLQILHSDVLVSKPTVIL